MTVELALDMKLRGLSNLNARVAVKEAFNKGGVQYYTEIPNPPENTPRQTILTLDTPGVKDWVEDFIETFNENETDPKKMKRLAWSSKEDSLENSNFGSFRHAVVVEYDPEGNVNNLLYDMVLWGDGPVEARTGLSTPGAVVIPIEKVGDEYYVHCFWQYRPAPYDDEIKVPNDISDPVKIQQFISLNRGMWFLTTPGGFARFAGDKPEAVAEREGMEEAGLKITAPVFDRKSFNRANVETLVRVGYSVFERIPGSELTNEGEKIMGKMAVRIDKFNTPDAMVEAALLFAMRDLGLISASKPGR